MGYEILDKVVKRATAGKINFRLNNKSEARRIISKNKRRMEWNKRQKRLNYKIPKGEITKKEVETKEKMHYLENIILGHTGLNWTLFKIDKLYTGDITFVERIKQKYMWYWNMGDIKKYIYNKRGAGELPLPTPQQVLVMKTLSFLQTAKQWEEELLTPQHY